MGRKADGGRKVAAGTIADAFAHERPRVMRGFILAALLVPAFAWADARFIPFGEERLKLNLGVLAHRRDTTLRLDAGSRGHLFELEDALGLDHDRTVWHASGAWRIAPRHRLGVRALELERDARHDVEESLNIRGIAIPVRTSLTARTELQMVGVDYRYSFVRTHDMEVSGLVGVVNVHFEARFQATLPRVDVDEAISVLAPVLGASADFALSPRWSVSLFGHGVQVDVGDNDAHIFNFGATTEYMMTRHLGLGIGYVIDYIGLNVNERSFRGRVAVRNAGVLAYVQARF